MPAPGVETAPVVSGVPGTGDAAGLRLPVFPKKVPRNDRLAGWGGTREALVNSRSLVKNEPCPRRPFYFLMKSPQPDLGKIARQHL